MKRLLFALCALLWVCSAGALCPTVNTAKGLFPTGSAMWKVEQQLNFCFLNLYYGTVNGTTRNGVRVETIRNGAVFVPYANQTKRLAMNKDKAVALLRQDIIAYYGLKDKCSTPLQRKKYMESAEFKIYKQKFDAIYRTATQSRCYVAVDVESQYSMENHNFRISFLESFSSKVLSTGSTYFKTYTNDPKFGREYFVTPEIDEDTAYKIETSECAAVFVGNLKQLPSHSEYLDGFRMTPLEVYIANKKTGEIYMHYTVQEEQQKVEAKSDNVSQSQNTQANNGPVYTMCDVMPAFNGNLNVWLSQNMLYPASAAESGIEGKVIVKFVIRSDGSISDACVTRGVDPQLDREALRVVNAMPKWKPGMNNGKPVNVLFQLPLTFRLQH